jgi:tryptophan synthase alpha chain
MSRPLMCHVVAGYPNSKDCLKLLLGMQAAGVTAIEVQIPFSDPIADGETIMKANDIAIEQGMTTESSFKLIETARKGGLETELFAMSYVQKLSNFGFEAFCIRAASCQLRGLILPDLPYDSPDYRELSGLAQRYELQIVPVLSPGMSPERLATILKQNHANIYVTTQRGITGKTYAGGAEFEKLIANIRKTSKARLMIGFGIATASDVDAALMHGDMAVVGSAVINKVQAVGVEKTLDYIRTLAGNA